MAEIHKESVETENNESATFNGNHTKNSDKKGKVEKLDLICPNAKCSARNSVDRTLCILCKTSLEDAKTIVIADDWGNLFNYISISGVLFVLLGLAFAKYSLVFLAYCLIVAVIMWPVLLRTVFKKLGRKPPGFIMRTVVALIFMLGAAPLTPSPEQMKAKDDKDSRDAAVAAAVRASEEAAEKKTAEQEEKQRRAEEAAEKKAEEDANKATPSPDAPESPSPRMKDWAKSGDSARREIALTLTQAMLKKESQLVVAVQAIELEACLNKLAQTAEFLDQEITGMAAMCALGMGWNKE